MSSEHWRLVQAMVGAVDERWEEPDHGIWEARRPPRHHVYSKTMCWVTVDRALQVADELPGNADAGWDAPFCTVENLQRYYEHLETTLSEIGFLDPAAPRQLMTRLRRMFNRIRPDQMEVNILRGFMSAINRLGDK